MKLSLLIGGAVGYVLGARAGRERYEQIVRLARTLQGSQTVQSTAGVLQAQVDSVARKVRRDVGAKLHLNGGAEPVPSVNGVNGHRR